LKSRRNTAMSLSDSSMCLFDILINVYGNVAIRKQR